MNRPIALIGMMGSGKTTTGQALSQKMGLPWMDTDHWIEAKSKKKIPAIFAEDGEASFRRLESQALAELLESHPIIATGGGIVTQPQNRDRLKNGAFVVYLKGTLQTLISRTEGSDRPLLKQPNALAELMEKRRSMYEECADLAIATDDLTVDEVVEKILKHL